MIAGAGPGMGCLRGNRGQRRWSGMPFYSFGLGRRGIDESVMAWLLDTGGGGGRTVPPPGGSCSLWWANLVIFVKFTFFMARSVHR